MNIEQTKKAIAVMQAFVDGKKIKIKGPYAVKEPEWNWTDNDYATVPGRIEGWAVIDRDGDFVDMFTLKSNARERVLPFDDLRVVKLVEERE